MTSQFISSRFVEESSAATFDLVSAHAAARLARLGGDVSSFVSAHVRARLEAPGKAPERRSAGACGRSMHTWPQVGRGRWRRPSRLVDRPSASGGHDCRGGPCERGEPCLLFPRGATDSQDHMDQRIAAACGRFVRSG
jgi:hypothetical protein